MFSAYFFLPDFKEKVNNATLSYSESLAKIIPRVRSAPTNATTLDELHDLTQSYLKSCFNFDTFLFYYLTTRTREVNAINIFYTQTINKAAPQINQFREAEIAEALITKKSVFILTLRVIANTTNQFFDTNFSKQCGKDRHRDNDTWFNNRTTTGTIGHTWRQFLAFYTANYNLTTSGKVTSFIINDLVGKKRICFRSLHSLWILLKFQQARRRQHWIFTWTAKTLDCLRYQAPKANAYYKLMPACQFYQLTQLLPRFPRY